MRYLAGFALVMVVHMFCGAAPRSSRFECKNEKCLRPNVLVEQDVGRESRVVLTALPVGITRLLVPVYNEPGMVHWENRTGSLMGIDPTYRLKVYRFPTSRREGLFTVPELDPAEVSLHSFIHSHVPKTSGNDMGWQYRVERKVDGHLVLNRPLDQSELGAVFYSATGKFVGIGAEISKTGATVVVTAKAVSFFMTPD